MVVVELIFNWKSHCAGDKVLVRQQTATYLFDEGIAR